MKKLTIVILMLLITIGIFAQTPLALEGELTGTTTNTATVVDSLYSGRFTYVGIQITNTGSSSNDLTYTLKGYLSDGATQYESIGTATDLSDGEKKNFAITNAYYKLNIELSASTTDSLTTYECSWIMRYH